MSDENFDLNEFMETPVRPVASVAELDVQKAVVEELAAEKVELNESISSLEGKVRELAGKLEIAAKELSAKCAEAESSKKAVEDCRSEIADRDKQIDELKAKLSDANAKIIELDAKINEKLIKELDEQERNPNSLALLDRDVELPDRFPGETRDHVLEVVKEARDLAEKEGRRRRAQLLEGVLVSNEPSGNLAKKRCALAKFFNDNGNIINGKVISELERCSIAYKDGEEYLLPKEILLRTY